MLVAYKRKSLITMHYYSSLLFILLNSCLFGQDSLSESYFQQEVDFHIQVSLDDKQHILRGDWQMEYTNHSPVALDFIYIHLWPNAFSNRTTAFAQQKLNFSDTEFYFANDNYLGNIDSLAFESDGQTLVQEVTTYGPDVIKLVLNTPLLSGQEVRINSPFRVKIPGSFSRLGHINQSYQITQWYPKPAVYDQEGWHPMPYLDYGEYYSEFGSFDVSITLPSNYLVGATGKLTDEEERNWLLQKASENMEKTWAEDDPETLEFMAFPESSQEIKTLHYHAKNVHDFAWFADKRFYVLHDTIQLSENKVIDAWSFFTDNEAHLWQNSIEYIKRSTHFYADKVGEYPYPQVTALQSALSAGGGMEYPMVTVIGLSGTAQYLDEVIAHEVGHNWFYGILASNERDHAWMDEGFNSYYDQRYTREYYDGENDLEPPLSQGPHTNLDGLAYQYFACKHSLHPPDTPAEKLKGYDYWIGAYGTPSIALRQLEEHIGKDSLDSAMQFYFEQWKFKHPQPNDVQKSLETALGESLEWLFQGFIASSNTQDYAVHSVNKKDDHVTLNIQNKGQIAGPFSVTTKNEAGEENIYKIDGFNTQKIISLPSDNYTNIRIDPSHNSLDLNRKNNYWNNRWGRLEPPKLKFFSLEKDEKYSNLFLTPFVGFNEHDGVLIGTGFYNRTLLPSPFEFGILPMYGFKSKKIVGLGAARYRWWPQSDKIKEVSLIANYRSFHFRTYNDEKFPLTYRRISPALRLDFMEKRNWASALQFRSIWLNEDYINFSIEGEFFGALKKKRQINELSYHLHRKWVLAPVDINIAIEQSNYTDAFNRDQDYVKLRLETKGKILYNRKKAFHWRFFGGLFLSNSLNFISSTSFSLFDNGASDYRYDNLYLDRSASDGIMSQQLANRAGGFHAPVSESFNLGLSNNHLFSVNTSADLPFTPDWLPIKPFLDAASFWEPDFDGGSNQFLWNAGLAMEWLDGKIGIYLPLAGSPEIMDRLKEQGGIGQRFSFRVVLRDLSPWNWIDRIESL